jgi:hypothetical protein
MDAMQSQQMAVELTRLRLRKLVLINEAISRIKRGD